MLGIAFTSSVTDGEDVFTVRHGGRLDLNADDPAALAPRVQQFRFLVTNDSDATTWLVGVPTVVAAMNSR